MITFALAAALSAQALLQTSVTSADPMFGPDPSAPAVAPGLWAAVGPDCAEASRPGALGGDLSRWPGCAQPLRIERGSVALVSAPRDGAGPPLRMLSTAFELAPAWPGAPAVVQLEVPGLLDTTYAYAALQPGPADAQGRFTAADLWPVACPGPGVQGIGPERTGCQAGTPTGVHQAARLARPEPLLTLRWIAP